jgi:hypothetical protein
MLNPSLHKMLVDAHAEELRRAGAINARFADVGPRRRRRLLPDRLSSLTGWLEWRRRVSDRPPPEQPITIRYAFADDAYALARLAALDSSPQPPQPILVAEVDGELWAAVSMVNGRVIADPFRPTMALVDLLVTRAVQLNTARSFRAVRPLAPSVWRTVLVDEIGDDARF